MAGAGAGEGSRHHAPLSPRVYPRRQLHIQDLIVNLAIIYASFSQLTYSQYNGKWEVNISRTLFVTL